MKMFDTSKLVQFPVTVRRLNRDTPGFKQLYQSIKRFGILVPLAVKPTAEGMGVFDGLQRLDIARTIGLPKVPCRLHAVSDLEVLVLQLQLNTYTATVRDRQLIRIAAATPLITLAELAGAVAINPNTLIESSLLRALPATLIENVISGKICFANAIALNRLARESQEEASKWLSKAMRQPPMQFMPPCHNKVRELKTAARSK